MLNEALNEIQKPAENKDQRLQMDRAQVRRMRRQRREIRSVRHFNEGWSSRMF